MGGFNAMHALSTGKKQLQRPMDKDRDGFVLGEPEHLF
jgi:3-oxoacyl-[acyl-carrier-protein] synthase II